QGSIMVDLDGIQRLLNPGPDKLVDLTKIWVAYGRKKGKYPTAWARWNDVEPKVRAVGGSNDPVWADEVTARDYASYLWPAFPPGRLNRKQLKDRGWTEGLIKRFLPTSDGSKGGYPRSAGRVKLYRFDRVVAIEQTEEFRAAREKATSRRRAA